MTGLLPPLDAWEFLVGPWRDAPDAAAWTILLGTLVATTCGWIGCYLMFQGLSLVGDAISHTALLGIVLAYLVTGQLTGPAVLVGAALIGLLTALGINWLPRVVRIKEDAATGIVFTALFALAVVLLCTFAGRAHLDLHHVLLGDIGLLSGDTVNWLGVEVPVAIAQLVWIALGLVIAQGLFGKELLVSAFDRPFAQTQGLRPTLMQFGLMAALSIVVVGSFSLVGAVLVVAMLITPGATAYLLTNRLRRMLGLVPVIGGLSALLGYHLAVWGNVSTGGSMVTAGCGLFGLALLLSPSAGILAHGLRRRRRQRQATEENLVRFFWRQSTQAGHRSLELAAVQETLRTTRLGALSRLRSLAQRGWLEPGDAPASWRLTAQGIVEARRLDRAHRLWEAYLVEHVGLPADHVHAAAEELEHLLDNSVLDRVDDVLGHPEHDPHGAPIPRGDPATGLIPLARLRIGEHALLTGLAETLTPQNPALLEEVGRLQLPVAGTVKVISRNAAAQTWTIELPSGETRELSHPLADALFVRVMEDSAPGSRLESMP